MMMMMLLMMMMSMMLVVVVVVVESDVEMSVWGLRDLLIVMHGGGCPTYAAAARVTFSAPEWVR